MGLKEPLICSGTAVCMLEGTWVVLAGADICWGKKV